MQPLRSRGSPIGRDKTRGGYIPAAFHKNQTRALVRYTVCVLGGPQWKRTKFEVATSSMPTPARRRAVLLCNPSFVRGPQQRGQNQNWQQYPYLLSGPNAGGIATQPVCTRGSPTELEKIKTGYITPGFSGPNAGGIATQPLRSQGSPIEDNEIRKGYITRAFSLSKAVSIATYPLISRWSPTKRDIITSGSITPAVGGPKASGIATPPVCSRGSPIEREKLTTGYLTPGFSGQNAGGIAT